MGPDLTNIISDSAKGVSYAKAFIQNGTAKMPDFKLTNSEVDNIVRFLAWVDKSGHSRIAADKVNWNGNYNLQN
jgi:nitric oxide reductase subunit C